MVRLHEPMRSIGEVAESLDLPQHVLRFWETRFKEIDPVKRAGGRRLYRQRDVDIVVAIRHLLYSEGYTIKGVQRILKERGVETVVDEALRRLAGQSPDAEGVPEEAGAGVDLPASDGDVDEMEAEALELPSDPPAPDIAPLPDPPLLAPMVEAAPRLLDEDDARLLRAALDEIEECRRLLRLTLR